MDRDSPKQQPDNSGSQGQPAEGISQFIAKVLDQLSVTAWLPATMLVGNAAVLLILHRQGNLDLAEALRSVTKSPLGLLIAMFIAVVLATMVSQAFAFETIRILEGYWGKYRPLQFMLALRAARHHKRYEALQRRRDEYEREAFKRAAWRMLDKEVPADLIEIQKSRLFGETPKRTYTEEMINEAREEHNRWESHCPPAWSRRLEALNSQIAQYPKPSRILPTRLGNTLRSWEDKLVLADDEDLEGLVLRDYDRMPPYLQVKHDQFRNRLDMYCTLAFVFFVLAVLAGVLLSQGSGGWIAGSLVGLFYFALAWMSYEAAISSARGYGAILLAINSRNRSSNTG